MNIINVMGPVHGNYYVNDNAIVFPDNMNNRHRRKLQAWIDAGNTPTPYSAPVKTYAENREVAYNALNQFELISDDSINGTTTHKDAIIAIKAAHPKPV